MDFKLSNFFFVIVEQSENTLAVLQSIIIEEILTLGIHLVVLVDPGFEFYIYSDLGKYSGTPL